MPSDRENSDLDTIEKEPKGSCDSISLTIGGRSSETAYLLEQKKISYTQPLAKPPFFRNPSYQKRARRRREKEKTPGKRRRQPSGFFKNYDSEMICSSEDQEKIFYEAQPVGPRHFGNQLYKDEREALREKKRNSQELSLPTPKEVSLEKQLPKEVSLEEQSPKEISLEEQYREIVNTIVVDTYRAAGSKEAKVVNVLEEENLLRNLIEVGKDIDATAEEITKELVETATNLRRMTIAAANTARASWKNYCLSFFCCASSPVQYNQLLFYILIERALNRAEQRNLIRGVNLERLSDPAIREQKLRRVLVI